MIGGDYSGSGSTFTQSFCNLYLQLEESEGRRLLPAWINFPQSSCTMYLQLEESEVRRLLPVWINLSPVLLHHVSAAVEE
jgi:hypothetical protein